MDHDKHMDYVAVGFDPPLDGQQVFARGHYGLLFEVLKQDNPSTATWLHTHESPKPFSTLTYYTNDGYLAGIRYALLTDEAASIMYSAWRKVENSQQTLKLGLQKFKVAQVEIASGPNFQEMSESAPVGEVRLQFLSPTAFKQGKTHLTLPLPRNIFYRPLTIWQHYAPIPLRLRMADSWLDWCAQNIYVSEHQIETATIAITYHESFTGFVGTATFAVYHGNDEQRRILQALAKIAAFSGIGHKTTMGMGAVHFQADSR